VTPILKPLFWTIYYISILLVSLLMAWQILSLVNFGYPAAYRLLSLDKHIDDLAPANINRQGFGETSGEERIRAFSGIVDAIQHSGKGLKNITYRVGAKNVPLLTKAEVIHLQDVANLIDLCYRIVMVTSVIALLLLAAFKWKKITPPGTRQIMVGTIVLSAITTSVVLALGPKQVFYWFHIKIFPQGHQWFFYYQESLMSTLMKAPDLFGFIAVLIVVLALCIFCIACYGTQILLTTGHK
jgi:hypothetical protein